MQGTEKKKIDLFGMLYPYAVVTYAAAWPAVFAGSLLSSFQNLELVFQIEIFVGVVFWFLMLICTQRLRLSLFAVIVFFEIMSEIVRIHH